MQKRRGYFGLRVLVCTGLINRSCMHPRIRTRDGFGRTTTVGSGRSDMEFLRFGSGFACFFTQEPASHGGEEAGAVSSMVCAFVCFRCQGSR